LFICVTDLARMLENYLALGTYKETKKFIKEYHLFSVFETFFKALK